MVKWIIKNAGVKQLPKSLQSTFLELKISNYLRKAGIVKGLGFSCLTVFCLVFSMVFENKNWFRLLQSSKKEDLPGKNVVYRFLNNPRFGWRNFLLAVSQNVISKMAQLTSSKRKRVLIIDDSLYSRGRSNKVELLANVFDHTSSKFVKGFRMLTLGWSDGHSFVPIDFSLLSSSKPKNRYCETSSSIDKRTHGYKRRQEAIQNTPEVVLSLVSRTLKAGVQADTILMDSWFMFLPLIKSLHNEGLTVIGMVKDLNQRYIFGGKWLTLMTLKDLYKKSNPVADSSDKRILSSVMVEIEPGIRAKIVFVRNIHQKRQWLALLSTDCTLSNEEIVRCYGMRWDIETFFKVAKSYLQLAKEFQGRSYDMMVAHTSIIFTRYIVLSWESRLNTDPKSLGELFFIMCDEVKELDYQTALTQLLSIMNSIVIGNTVESQAISVAEKVDIWLQQLPTYIRKKMLPAVANAS